ncbi:MAG: fibronectin type III domain-containing protein, partial [Desulfobulbales bacterium]|nr:fibronectin type III domain-containing protein [Desulfobulbales bacterium]
TTTTTTTTTLPQQTVPSTPTGLSATAVSSSRIDLNWNDNNNETGYTVEKWINSAPVVIATLNANVTSYQDSSGLEANTVYYYRISAFNQAGDSPFTSWISARTDATTTTTTSTTTTTTTLPQPQPPTGLSANAVSASQINLNWTDNDIHEDGFRVERAGNGAAWTLIASLAANTTSYIDYAGLNPGITYSYRVSCFGASGSAVSNTASAATPGVIYVDNMAGSASRNGNIWDAQVTITVADQNGAPVPGVIVDGSWSPGGADSCETDNSGQCTVYNTGLDKKTVNSTTFTVTDMDMNGYVYDPGSNNETSYTVVMP